MRNSKLLKKIDMRLIQNLVMVLIVVLFLYLFYYFYGQFTAYQNSKKQGKRGEIKAEVIAAPQFFSFTPPKDKINQYRIFTFKEQKTAFQAEPGAEEKKAAAQNKPPDYRILGVVKMDKLYLVVRMISTDKIRLCSQGMSIDKGSSVQELNIQRVVIADASGGRKEHKIFQMKPIKFFDQGNKKAKPPVNKPVNKQFNKQGKKQGKNNNHEKSNEKDAGDT
ncbi:MAG: hypothetical protein GY940_40870 [bacterium]|nr:hypothetical protein [bacterium]